MPVKYIIKVVRLPICLAAAGPIDTVTHHDIVDSRIKTAKSIDSFEDPETGMDRIKRMFQLDDYDNISPELHSIYNAGFLGMFTGLCYGGFIGSRKAYTDFMERNQATAFETHLQAKKKLQDSMMIAFAKTGWKLGWRIGLFAMTYVGISTFISVYRNEFTIFEYIVGGAATGAIYKWKMGPRGMFAGLIIGGGLGLIGGAFSVGIMKLTGTTMKEIRYWQYKWKSERIQAYKEGWDKSFENTDLSFKKSKLQSEHDANLGEKAIELSQLPDK